MTTLDTVFLIITASALSIFFILAAVLLGYALKLVAEIRSVVKKAEEAITTVEAATETFKNIGANANGPLAALKVIANIVKLVNKR